MNAIIKNVLGVVLIFMMLGIIAAVTQYVGVYEKSIDPTSFRSFSVSGDGKAVGIPDTAQFDFTVITNGGKNIGTLQKDNAVKMNAAISFLKSKGIDAKDIKTQSYNVQPRYQYYNCSKENGICPPPEIVGYNITQTALVKIRDFAIIGDTLSGLVDKGANSVSGLSFTIDDSTVVQNEARQEAINKAHAKAQSLAQAGGFVLGKLISIEEGSSYQPPMYAMESARYGMGGGPVSPSPSIEAGSQDVTVSVTLRYEIR